VATPIGLYRSACLNAATSVAGSLDL
jgi:hypothetical protein